MGPRAPNAEDKEMTLITAAARLTGAGLLTLALAACMDVEMTIDIQSQTEAEATMVTAMAADMYQMIMAQSVEGEDEFCAEGELIERGDMMECHVVQSGPFAELDLDAEGGGPVIAAIGGGQVRVSFPTGDIAEAMAEDTGARDDPQMMAMITSMFEGHAITMTVAGGTITDTNMAIAADGQSASYAIPFTDLFASDLDLPAELYAVVQK
ncbi:hypothetical protein DVH29_06600 [Pelagibacterium lacus]|uniref:Uncharacterized protein n=2 Tax=Pelagibacterium lacus TaxID=2282655 RepID=A0A369W4I8_9HYPH|nr:hypothetical protein DVH29_06600 [Pelagibacterium lacus]